MSKGGRPPTGLIRWQYNHDPEVKREYGRVTKADGSRLFALLDPNILQGDRAAALKCAVETALVQREPHGRRGDRQRRMGASG